MIISGYIPQSLNNYGEDICAVVFIGGCNFKCGFCHNGDIVNKIQQLDEYVVLQQLLARKKLIDAVTITGGEPLTAHGVLAFIRKLKHAGFKVKLDTNGSWPSRLQLLLDNKLIDYVAMDIKAPLQKYPTICGVQVNTDNLKKSMELLKNSGIQYEYRTTAIPMLDALDFETIGSMPELQGCTRYVIQQFNPDNCMAENYRNLTPYATKNLEEYVEILRKYFNKVELLT
jgi:pyruvate formate lyase activating enzyme